MSDSGTKDDGSAVASVKTVADSKMAPGKPTFSSLYGFRAVLCLWMIAFHSYFFMNGFVYMSEHQALGKHPLLLWICLGFLPVDGFYVLTGFLIAYPLLDRLNQEVIKNKEKPSSDPSTISPSFSVQSYFYRRMVRMVPVYAVAVFLFCFVVFPGGVMYPVDMIINPKSKEFFQRVLPSYTHVPNHCNLQEAAFNFLFTNNLLPFGGCMIWTWSFAVQFQFYIWFPLLWKWALSAGNLVVLKRRVWWSSVAVIGVGLAFRIYAFYHSRPLPVESGESSVEAIVILFFWYSNTFTRIGVIFTGVLVAYACVFTTWPRYLKANVRLANALWLLAASVLTCQLLWTRWFANGNVVETPGYSALLLSQPYGAWAVWGYGHHLLYYTLAVVGGPASGAMFAYCILGITHSLGSIGPTLYRVLSKPFWVPIADASFFAYLIHPIVMVKMYATVFYPPTVSLLHVPAHYAVNLGITMSVSYTLHLLVEKPIERWLRSPPAPAVVPAGAVSASAAGAPVKAAAPTAEFEHPTLSRFIYYYCCVALVWGLAHHVLQTPFMMLMQPNPQ